MYYMARELTEFFECEGVTVRFNSTIGNDITSTYTPRFRNRNNSCFNPTIGNVLQNFGDTLFPAAFFVSIPQ